MSSFSLSVNGAMIVSTSLRLVPHRCATQMLSHHVWKYHNYMVHVYTYIFFLSVYGICMVYQVNDDVSRIFKLELQDFLVEKK